MQAVDFIFSIAVLIMSVVVHEVSHGYTAYSLGDSTAKYEGRLTLNPLKHLDLFGSVILPALTYLLGGFIFGWAKPVPYNPYNLRNQRWGSALVAVAGPSSNIALALIFGLVLRFGSGFVSSAFAQALSLIVFINLLLALFNLIPIPPLDGSKILFTLTHRTWPEVEYFLEKWGLVLLILVIFFLFRFIFPLVLLVFKLITGFGLF